MPQKALLTVALPGNATPSMQLFDDMMVLAPSDGEERESVMALLIEALAILSPPNPRHTETDATVTIERRLKLVQP